jgi:hypothetical protein
MDTIRFSETSVFIRATQRNIPEDGKLRIVFSDPIEEQRETDLWWWNIGRPPFWLAMLLDVNNVLKLATFIVINKCFLLLIVLTCLLFIQIILSFSWHFSLLMQARRPPLWSSGQSSWLLTQRSRVQFLELPEFLLAVGLERGPLSHCEDKWGATWKKSSGSGLENWDQRP